MSLNTIDRILVGSAAASAASAASASNRVAAILSKQAALASEQGRARADIVLTCRHLTEQPDSPLSYLLASCFQLRDSAGHYRNDVVAADYGTYNDYLTVQQRTPSVIRRFECASTAGLIGALRILARAEVYSVHRKFYRTLRSALQSEVGRQKGAVAKWIGRAYGLNIDDSNGTGLAMLISIVVVPSWWFFIGWSWLILFVVVAAILVGIVRDHRASAVARAKLKAVIKPEDENVYTNLVAAIESAQKAIESLPADEKLGEGENERFEEFLKDVKELICQDLPAEEIALVCESACCATGIQAGGLGANHEISAQILNLREKVSPVEQLAVNPNASAKSSGEPQ